MNKRDFLINENKQNNRTKLFETEQESKAVVGSCEKKKTGLMSKYRVGQSKATIMYSS